MPTDTRVLHDALTDRALAIRNAAEATGLPDDRGAEQVSAFVTTALLRFQGRPVWNVTIDGVAYLYWPSEADHLCALSVGGEDFLFDLTLWRVIRRF